MNKIGLSLPFGLFTDTGTDGASEYIDAFGDVGEIIDL